MSLDKELINKFVGELRRIPITTFQKFDSEDVQELCEIIAFALTQCSDDETRTYFIEQMVVHVPYSVDILAEEVNNSYPQHAAKLEKLLLLI